MRELELLRHIYGSNTSLPDRVTVPPGDDMGAVRIGGEDVLVTVDQVADGIHVDLASTPLKKVGRKAIARSLSDVAAMGAVPAGAVVAASLPRRFGHQDTKALFDVMRQSGAMYDCPLFGGDISIWDHPLLLTVTVLASTAKVAPVSRRGAKAGDAICVTGALGGSLETVDGTTHHLDFEPRLQAGRALALAKNSRRPHCMIDLSDGLAVDLGHLCREAGLAATVEANQLPISRAATVASAADHRPPWLHAIGDGEDYELCFTIDPAAAHHWISHGIGDVAVTQIGRMIEGDGGPTVRIRRPDGQVESAANSGWEHR